MTVIGRRRWFPHHPLGREIALLLAIKFVLLVALYLAFFAPWMRPDVDSAAMAGRLAERNAGTD